MAQQEQQQRTPSQHGSSTVAGSTADGGGGDSGAAGGKQEKTRITMRPLSEIEAQLPGDTSEAAPEGSGDEASFDVQYGGGPNADKFRKNPLVPLGAIVTGCVLMGGLFAFKSGNTRLSQQMMRARVVAQGATLAILGLSVGSMTQAAGVTRADTPGK